MHWVFGSKRSAMVRVYAARTCADAARLYKQVAHDVVAIIIGLPEKDCVAIPNLRSVWVDGPVTLGAADPALHV